MPAVRVPSYNLALVPYFRGMSEAEFQALVDARPRRHDFPAQDPHSLEKALYEASTLGGCHGSGASAEDGLKRC